MIAGGRLARGAGPDTGSPAAQRPWRDGLLDRLLEHHRRPVAAGTALCHSTRSWLSRHRPELQRGALLGLVGLVTLSLALVCWRATIHRQLQMDASRTDAASPERLLVADLEARSLRRSLEDAQIERRSVHRPTESDRPTARRRSTGANGQGLEVSGPVLAAASSAMIITAGLGLARRVLRRQRSAERTAAADVDALDEPVPPIDGGALGVTGQQEVDDREAEEQAVETHDGSEPEPDRGVAGTVAASADVPAVAGSRQAESPTAGTWVGHDPEPAATTRFPLLALVAEARSSERLPGGADFSAGERLFERRELPEIDHVCAATVEVAGLRLPATVLQLSERGVSCRIEAGQVQPPPSAGRIADYARVQFPVSSRTLDAKVQVAWRKTSPGGTYFGLRFLPLPAQDADVIRSTCLAAVRGEGPISL